MYRSPRKLSGLVAIGAIGLTIGLAACTQPAATASPDAMINESPSPAMMNESPSPAMMHDTASPSQ